MQEDQKVDELTNEELVLCAAGGCDRARNLMMEKNEGLVVSKAKIYWEGIYSSGMDKSLTQDDFIQLARIELWKAIDKFKPELGNKFSTYAGVCIENKLKSLATSVKKKMIVQAASWSAWRNMPAPRISLPTMKNILTLTSMSRRKSQYGTIIRNGSFMRCSICRRGSEPLRSIATIIRTGRSAVREEQRDIFIFPECERKTWSVQRVSCL